MAMSAARVTKKKAGSHPPKCASTNWFAIDLIPQNVSFFGENVELHLWEIDTKRDLYYLICVTISPVRPFMDMLMLTQLRVKNNKRSFFLLQC